MRRAWGVVLAVVAGLAATRADEVVVADVDGKETKLSGAKLGAGTRRLAWLADPNGATADAKLGPVAVEVREPNSTTFAKGVVTLVPAAHLEAVRYDYEKLSAAFVVKGLKDPLSGTLQYKGINTLGVSGTADGKAASFAAGTLQAKGAVKTVTFPGAVEVPAAKGGGTAWAVQIVQPKADNPTVKARNLKVLCQFKDGTQDLLDAVPSRKGAAVPFDAKLTRFEMLANDENTNIAVAEVDAGGERVVAIPLAVDKGGKSGVVVGLLGEVEAGYKLFPLHTVKVIVPLAKKAD
jgi:hypothetical protein